MKRTLLALLAVGLFASVASAQNAAYTPYPYWGAYQPAFASTVAEGYLRGQADVIRSKGYYNEASSRALINVEDARSKFIDNQVKYTHAYFEKRQLNRTYRAAERLPRPSQETLARLASQAAPGRLHSGQLDPTFGTVNWPTVLEHQAFTPLRERLDALFADRLSSPSGIGSENYQQIQIAASMLKDQLKHNIHNFEPTSYVAAKNFVESLAYEARYNPALNVAQR